MSGTGNTSAISENDVNSASANELITQADVNSQKEKGFPILTEQERAFGYEYITNGYNHRSAAEKCGRPADAGVGLKRKPYIAAFIAHLQEVTFQSEIIVKDFIDAKLDDLYDMAVGEVEVPLVTGDGSTFTAKKFQGGLALNIIQERAKLHGITKPAEEGGGGVKVYIDMRAALGEKSVDNEPIEGNFVEIK